MLRDLDSFFSACCLGSKLTLDTFATSLAERVVQATALTLKDQLSSPESLLDFVQSLEASHYKFWSDSNDTVTELINTLCNNKIPTEITNKIKEIRYVELSMFS